MPHPHRTPHTIECDACRAPVEPEQAFWADIGSAPWPLCEGCAQVRSETFTEAAAILEAVLIVKQHQRTIGGVL